MVAPLNWRQRLRQLFATDDASSPEKPSDNPRHAPLFDEAEFNDLVSVLNVSHRRAAMAEQQLWNILQPAVKNEQDVKTALLDATRYLTSEFPDVNFALLWHVVLKAAYTQTFTANSASGGLFSTPPVEQARQSWASHSGGVFERLIAQRVTETLPNRLRVVRLDNHALLRSEIERGLGIEDGLDQKYDLALLGKHDGQWYAFGALHAKTTLRERLNDDDSASKHMMEKGLYSAVVCASVGPNKSRDNPVPSEFNKKHSGKSNQRKTIEEEGRFNAAFCLNQQTRPTPDGADTNIVQTANIRTAPNNITENIRRAWENRLANEELIAVSPPYDG